MHVQLKLYKRTFSKHYKRLGFLYARFKKVCKLLKFLQKEVEIQIVKADAYKIYAYLKKFYILYGVVCKQLSKITVIFKDVNEFLMIHLQRGGGRARERKIAISLVRVFIKIINILGSIREKQLRISSFFLRYGFGDSLIDDLLKEAKKIVDKSLKKLLNNRLSDAKRKSFFKDLMRILECQWLVKLEACLIDKTGWSFLMKKQLQVVIHLVSSFIKEMMPNFLFQSLLKVSNKKLKIFRLLKCILSIMKRVKFSFAVKISKSNVWVLNLKAISKHIFLRLNFIFKKIYSHKKCLLLRLKLLKSLEDMKKSKNFFKGFK
jgi:hypothetical protein